LLKKFCDSEKVTAHSELDSFNYVKISTEETVYELLALTPVLAAETYSSKV